MISILSVSEEFLRLCPGGIGFVPDPYTLVIKGRFYVITFIIILITKLSILIGSPHAYLQSIWSARNLVQLLASSDGLLTPPNAVTITCS